MLFVLWDDFGWAGAGYNRAVQTPEVRTPNTDALVATGINFTHHYVFYCCSPTRAAIQSGRNPIHVNVLNADPDTYNASDPVSGMAGIARNMTGIATKMAAGGYRTHFVGKWDAGMASLDHTPRGRGYHTGLNYFHHENNYWTMKDTGDCNGVAMLDLWAADEDGAEGPGLGYTTTCPADYNRTTGTGCVAGPLAPQADHGYEDRLFAGRVQSIIQAHNPAEPSFVFWSPHNIHTSLMVPESYLAEFDFMQPTDKQGAVWSHDPVNLTKTPSEGHTRQLYSAMVHFADAVLGEVVDLYKARGMYNDTLIVFSTDNGGAIYGNGSAAGNNFPLRGGKGSLWEGGIRGACWASGGWLPASVRGTRHSGLVAAWDWYATFSTLAGIEPADSRAAAAGLPPIDSVSVLDVLVGAVRGDERTKPRTVLPLGTEPTDGFPLGTTVGGLIEQGQDGALYKLILGPIKQACWTSPIWPNRTTNMTYPTEPCTTGTKLGCLFRLDIDPEERADLGGSPAHQGTVHSMLGQIEAYRQTAYNPLRGGPDKRACRRATSSYHGYWGPFVP